MVEVDKIDPNITNENKSTGLHFACSKGKSEVVKYLHRCGAHLGAVNVSGLTPFDCACLYGHLSLCRWLFQTKIISLNPEEGNDQRTPLHFAASHGRQEVVEWLVNMGANIQARSPVGTTPLMEAAHNGHLKIVQFLHKNGAAIDCSDSEKVRAIHLAASNGHLDVVQYLESHGVGLDQADGFGKTPFLHACSGGHLALARWLKERHVNVMATGGFYDKLNTSLHLAAQHGDLKLVSWLVEECYLNPLARNMKNATPIDFARAAGHEEVVAYLTEQLQLHHAPDGSLVTDLEQALEMNDIPTATRLIETILNSPIPIPFPYNTTPLHYVAASGLVEIAQYLIMSGADVNATSDIGRTPLHYSVFKERVTMAKYLYSVGGNPVACDVNGINCLTIAKKTQNTELINWFNQFGTMDSEGGGGGISAGTRAGSGSGSQFSLLSCFSDNSVLPNSHLLDYDLPDPSIFSASLTSSSKLPDFKPQFNPKLHEACSEGNLDEVKYYVGMGLSVNSRKDVDEPTPLHCAITSGNLEVVKYLIEKGAFVNAVPMNCVTDPLSTGTALGDELDYENELMTPLHLACDQQNMEMALLLIRSGANLHIKNRAGDTPLHIICLLGMTELLQEIISLPRSLLPSLNLDVRSNHLLNLLHCAADAGSYGTCALLIHEDIGLNSYDDEKKTPLHYACGKGSLEVTQLLITHGAIIDLEDSSKRTPFLYACSSGNEDLIKYLVEMGAKVDATTNKGNNALHIACKVGHLALVQWLISQGVNPDQRNANYQFPIYFAHMNGYEEITRWLHSRMVTPEAEIARSLTLHEGD
jgi:ankyrin repeat protein